MHQPSVAEEIVAAALSSLEAHGGGTVSRVHVVVGAAGYLDQGILGEAFVMAAAGTATAVATLDLETPPDLCAGCAHDLDSVPAGLAVTAIDVDE